MGITAKTNPKAYFATGTLTKEITAGDIAEAFGFEPNIAVFKDDAFWLADVYGAEVAIWPNVTVDEVTDWIVYDPANVLPPLFGIMAVAQ